MRGNVNNIGMIRTIKWWIYTVCVLWMLNGCSALKAPVVVKNRPMAGYKYVFIPQTKEVMSSKGDTWNGQYVSTAQSVNPREIISGVLMKNGFVVLPELKSELNAKTLIVNYGESGRRRLGLGSVTEVTIQFVSADTYELVSSCTAEEGHEKTEADDIRQAIHRALSKLFGNK